MKTTIIWLFAAVIVVAALTLPAPVGAAEKKVAVMWEGKSGMQKRIQSGFHERMRQIAPDVGITSRREIKGFERAEKIFREFAQTHDAVIFQRSSGAEFLAKADPKIPCFVAGCNNPKLLGVIQNLDAPEGVITGVTYFIPYEKRVNAIKSLFPQVKSVALLLEKGHPIVSIERNGTRSACERLGLAYHEVVASNSDEMVRGTEALAKKVDLFIISNTRLAIDNSPALVAVQNRSKIPFFSYPGGKARYGVLAEMAADDVKLGRMLADSVVDVVVEGKAISQVPVKMDPDPKLVINKTALNNLGIKIPDDMRSRAEFVE